MKWLFYLLVLVVGVVCIYGYRNNPSGCAKLGKDLRTDLPVIAADVTAIYTPPTETVTDRSNPGPTGPATPLPIPANTLLLNGDFSQGNDHWDGDGKTPDEYAAANPAARGNPLTAKGCIVTLNPKAWTRIYQTFRANSGKTYSIIANYRLSPGISISTNPADYNQINKVMGVPGFEKFDGHVFPASQFYGTVGDSDGNYMVFEVYAPNLGTTEIQNYEHTYPPSPITETKIFVLAFPPGSGTVTILSAAVMAN